MALRVPEIWVQEEMTSSHWIAENIRCRDCYSAVRVKPGVDICKCFKKLEDHDKLTDKKTWSKEKNTQTSRTNAYGDAVIKNTEGVLLSKFKYVRVDEDTDMEITRNLLLEVWQVHPPDWIINVMGEVVEESEEMEKKFNSELTATLSNIASNSVVWFVTEGLNEGLSCLAGAAAVKCREDDFLCDKIVPLGVMSWGDLECSESLLNSKRPTRKETTEYVIHSGVGDQLGKTITHSLLVDNGTRNPILCNTSFQMFWVNMALNLAEFDDDSSSLPLVTLMYGGWSYLLDGIKRSLLEDIPIVIIKGSGGIADILATGYKESHSIVTGQGREQDERWRYRTGTVMDSVLVQRLRRRIERFQRQKKGVEEVLYAILQCLQKRYLLTVYDMNNPSDSLLRAIVEALLKTKKTHELLRLMDQFFSSPVYDQKSYAKFGNLVMDDMFQSERAATAGKRTMEQILIESILMERVELAEFILDFEGVDLKALFTNKGLGELYRRSQSVLPKALIDDLNRHQKHETPWRVQKFVQGKIPSLCKIHEGQVTLDTQFIMDRLKLGPVHELFLWAVLANKSIMTQFFWKRGKDLIVSALVACTILTSIASSTESIKEKNKLKDHAKQFLALAIGTIDGCYNEDKEKTLMLLAEMQRRNHWKVNLLKIALIKFNRKVFSTLAYRNYTKLIWMGRIRHDTSPFKIAACTIFFPLIPWLISFNPSRAVEQKTLPNNTGEFTGLETLKGRGLRMSQDLSNTNPGNKSDRTSAPTENPAIFEKQNLSVWQKIGLFYCSPVVKYYFNLVFYVGFLLLYAIILLTHLPYARVSVLDIIMVVWIISFFVEKGYQFATKMTEMNVDNQNCMYYIKNFYSDKWNILDTVSLFGFVLGFGFRLIPVERPYEAGRLILSIDFICFSWRLLHIFTITKRIGPMLVMIWKMMMDLVPFLVILLVSILSFAVASEAIMYPNTPWSMQFVLFIPKKAFFSIFGEFFIDEIESVPDRDECTMDRSLWSNGTERRCPAPLSKYAVPLLMSIYILITNVLLLNILIARFNYTFQTIHELTDELWAWQSVRLTLDYDSKAPVPPPFTLIWRFGQLCRFCFCCCCKKKMPLDSFREGGLGNGRSVRSDANNSIEGGKSANKKQASLKRSPSDVSVRSHHSEKTTENENGDINMKTINRGDILVKSRSRTDLLKSMSRSELMLPQLKADDDFECSSVHDDNDVYIDEDLETEAETIGDFERSMGEIHLAVRPEVTMRGRKHDHADFRRPISVIRPTIRMKRMASRETEA